jgi:ATP-binding cassette subfamily B protein
VTAASQDYFRKNLKRAVITALLRPMLGLFFNLSTLVVLFYGGYLVMAQALTAGELVAFLQYLGLLAWPVIAIGWMTNLYQRGMASLKRINALLDAKPDVVGPAQPGTPDTIVGRIRFEAVEYAYGRGRPVLANLNLDIPRGSTIGISGPPGSGKTSLVQLIPRLYNAG